MKGLKHPITDDDLNAYVDDEISQEQRDDIHASLLDEPSLAARIETWRRQNEIIRAAFAKVAAEPLPASHALVLGHPPAVRTTQALSRAPVQDAVEEVIRDVRRNDISRNAQNSRIAGMTIAAFAAGALVTMIAAELSGMTGQLWSERSQPVAAPALGATPFDAGKLVAIRAIEAYHTYAEDIIRPVEIEASHEPLLMNWLSRRVGFTIHAPNLSDDGLTLLGGRLTPAQSGPAAFLLYEANGGDRISLFVTRAASDATLPLHYYQERSASAVFWLGDGAAYALAGRTGRDRLMRIAVQITKKLPPNTPP